MQVLRDNMKALRDGVVGYIHTAFDDVERVTGEELRRLYQHFNRKIDQLTSPSLPSDTEADMETLEDHHARGVQSSVLPSPLTTMENIKAKSRGEQLDYKRLNKEGVVTKKKEVQPKDQE